MSNILECERKLKETFALGGSLVSKDLNKSTFFKSVNVPSFLRDYLIAKYTKEDGSYDINAMEEFLHKYVLNKSEFLSIKDDVINNAVHREILAKVGIDINIRTGENHFSLPEYNITDKDTIIYDNIFNEYKAQFLDGHIKWAWVTLGYQYSNYNAKPKIQGTLKLKSMRNLTHTMLT